LCRFIGAYLENSPEYCFVVEDAQGVCGYVLAALDAKTHLEYLETSWIPAMKEKYPTPDKPAGEMSPAEVIAHCFQSCSLCIVGRILKVFYLK
jgi:protein O-GlcNAcase/histone acetyltransferase